MFKPSRDPLLFTEDIDPVAELERQGYGGYEIEHVIQQLRAQAMFRNPPKSLTQLILLLASDMLEESMQSHVSNQ